MSHVPQRKEKDCLNCGATVQGRFCHVCGQENVVPKETFWHMFTHFFYDITHFDSSFFHSIHHLILRPGFLSREYMTGRRASYLHPVRMYVFSASLFFLLFFKLFNSGDAIKTNINKPLSPKERAAYSKRLEEKLGKDTANSILKEKLLLAKDTTHVLTIKDALAMERGGPGIRFSGKEYKSKEEYDSLENLLPAGKRDGWFIRRLNLKAIELNEKFRENPDELQHKLGESILHRLPYMLLVSLPLFALILRIVYIRRKKFYYADHGVFTIHLYVFTFILLLAVFGLSELNDLTGWGFINILTGLLFVALFFYLYKAMRNFYGQGRGKTFLKFLLVTILSLLMMLVLFLLFMFFSAVTI